MNIIDEYYCYICDHHDIWTEVNQCKKKNDVQFMWMTILLLKQCSFIKINLSCFISKIPSSL